MILGIPYALWGLLGLLVPIIIHLLSKKERHVVHFGSLQFLKLDDAQSAKSLKLARYLLLLTRLLFIAVICFLVARPGLENGDIHKTFWVEEGSDIVKILALEDGQMQEDDVVIFRIARDSNIGSHTFPSIWTFMDHLNQRRDSSIVYGTATKQQFIGRPVSLAKHVQYNLIPKQEIIRDDQLSSNGQSLTKWSIYSDQFKTRVKAEPGSNLNLTEQTPPLKIGILSSEDSTITDELRTFISYFEEFLPYQLEWQDSGQPGDWNLVVGAESSYRNNTIEWKPGNQPISIDEFTPSNIVFSGRLDRESILESDLPVLIMSLLNRNYTYIDNYDERVYFDQMNDQFINEEREQKRSIQYSYASVSIFWWLMILPILGLERYLNYKKV